MLGLELPTVGDTVASSLRVLALRIRPPLPSGCRLISRSARALVVRVDRRSAAPRAIYSPVSGDSNLISSPVVADFNPVGVADGPFSSNRDLVGSTVVVAALNPVWVAVSDVDVAVPP